MQGVSLYRKVARLFSPGIEIREASEEDQRKIYRGVPPGGSDQIKNRMLVADFMAVTKKNEAVGFVQLLKCEEDGPHRGYWLYSLRVEIFYRRMGVGEKLTLAVIDRSRQEKAQELLLLVSADNREAIRLYRKLGFHFKTIPGLEEQLQKEAELSGCPRVVMNRLL
jgi:ribosomal protein S18 acetylase RimI-like enzyme